MKGIAVLSAVKLPTAVSNDKVFIRKYYLKSNHLYLFLKHIQNQTFPPIHTPFIAKQVEALLAEIFSISVSSYRTISFRCRISNVSMVYPSVSTLIDIGNRPSHANETMC